MKARINYRSKRTIIIISIAVVLLIAAIAGTVAFVKGNKDAAAAMTDDNHGTSQNDGTNAGLPNNGDQNDGSDQNNDGTTLPTDGDNTNPADSNNNDNNGSTTNDGTTGTNGANGSTTGTTNGANTGANAGTTTGTTTAGNNGANVPNQDYAQTTTVITENPWEKKEIGWSPISVAAYTAASKLKVHKPDLDLQKYAYLDGDSLEELPVNTAAQKGETITYVIKITNKGNEDTNGIRTIDSIPEGTELASISEGGALNNDGKIVWKNDIKAGETVTVSFKVVVTADSIDLINNIAKVNGEETPETKTPVITANKTAQVVTIVDKEEVLENRDAKVGETIRYTITAKNTTEVDGTTVIKDSIPDGTSFVDGTITEKGNFDKENGTITWNNVVVPAKGEVSVSFDVVVNEKTTAGEVVKSVSNTATIGNTPTEVVETKVANITGTKSVDKTEAKVGETLTYTITLTNSGNGDGKVTVTDRVPEGTTIKDSEINGYDSKTNIMTWKDVEVKAGKSVELTFEVIVNDNTSIIKNKAYVDENKIPEEPETSVKHHYTVEHYTENLDGTYSKVEKDTVVSEDVEIGTKVSYKINNYDGFTFDESKTENKDATVPDNNNLIVKLYYARRNDLSYTVYYKEQGTENELADAKVVDGQIYGNTVTENAIDIDGYNKVDPTSGNITITTGKNEYTFYYTKRNDLSYTVYYKEQGTENELADAKVVDGQTFGNVVTENAIDIDGYNKVDPTSGNITITTGKNEYTFYYTKRNDLSYTVYYKEQGTENELADAKVVDGQTFGNVVTENAIDIDGYNKVDPTSGNITITTGKNEYTFYYTKRNDLSYTVYYKEQGTEKELADAKVVDGQTFGNVVTENAIDIDGYNKVNPTSAEITITTGKNEYTFYYTKRNDLSYTVYYKEQGTENELADAKVVDGQTFGNVVTENAIDIDGYNKVNPTSAEITITTETNEHTFYYTKRNDLSYTVNYLEKGTNNVLHEAKTVGNQTFGTVVSASVTNDAIEKPEAIDGYNCVEVDKETLTIGTSTNEINFYYTKRTDLSYTVNYLEKGTNNVLHEAKTVGNQTFGTVVSASVTNDAIEKPEAIDGYNCVEVDKETLTIGTSTNEINFYYTKRTDLSYTVYYKEQGTENELADAKVVDGQTFGNVVTENAIDIDGYNKVDPTSANITITTGTNEHTFYYTKRADLSYTVYYKEQGTENELADAKVVDGQTFGNVVTENAIDIDGYNKVDPTSGNITITTGKNEYTFYYTKRNDLSYTVYYKEQGTENELADAKVVDGQTFGNVVTENAIDIDGYNKVNPTSAEITITTGTNEYTFYYTKRADLSYTVYYKEQGTENELADAKVVDGQIYGNTVTENAIDIDGYNKVDPTSADITITTGKNEYTFYYTKRNDLSYTVNYYYNGELKHSVTFDNMEYLDEISGVKEMPKYNGVTYTKYDLKTSSANGLLPLIIGTGSNYINVYYGTPNVTISKKVNKTAVKVGDTLHYTIKVTETRGFVDASGVNVTDPISEELENVRNITHNGKLNEGNVEWNNLAITKNSSIILEFDATVRANTIGKTISNTANLGGTTSGDSNTVTTTVSELKAAVKEVKKGTTGKDAVNIVLVMDLSYSMKSNKTSDGVTRLEAAKTAATKFINSIYTKDPESKVTVTVLTFNTANPLTTIKYVGTERCTNNNIWHLHLNCKNIDGVWYSKWEENTVEIPYSGTSKLGFADKSNYTSLVEEINEITLPNENPGPGLGTNVSAALDLTKTTIGDLKDNHSENSNVVILLSDGAPSKGHDGYEGNDNKTLINKASKIKGNPITTEFYSIQFGTEDGAYDLLKAMSSNNTVYTSNSIDSLVKNFTNILDQNTTKDPIDTVNGKYTTTLSNPLVVDADNPITVTYKGTTLFTCTSLPNNGLTYDSTTKTITWDINAWNAVEGHTKVTTNDIVIQCYVER